MEYENKAPSYNGVVKDLPKVVVEVLRVEVHWVGEATEGLAVIDVHEDVLNRSDILSVFYKHANL